MNENIKKAILLLSKRAETYESSYLTESFVDFESLLDSLMTVDHQIIYGRRGTGKTHLLRYLAENTKEDVSIYIDLRTIGSTGGVYNDSSIPLSERANRLILDVLGEMHSELLRKVIDDDYEKLDQWSTVLDNFASAITEVEVIGEKSIEKSTHDEAAEASSIGAEARASVSGIEIEIAAKGSEEKSRKVTRTVKISGKENYRIHFGRLKNCFSEIRKLLGGKRLNFLIDEWSELPFEIQPMLADLIRRTLLPIQGITVKLAAIEKRSVFGIDGDTTFGLEIGGDIPSVFDMDEYLVFDNNRTKAVRFFQSMITKHLERILKEIGYEGDITEASLLGEVFARSDGFEEFVRSSEGVPRDAINILTTCVQICKEDKVMIPDIRLAAKKWYNQGKEKNLLNKKAKALLRLIIDDVIGKRKARAFLINAEEESELIEELYDMRLIHLIKKSVSSKESPGERFNVYSIDYGCYVDLMNTSKEPLGLFEIEEGDQIKYVDVPENDYRSIRRAILNISEMIPKLT